MRNRDGKEVEGWRVKTQGAVRAEARTGARKGRMECQYGRWEVS